MSEADVRAIERALTMNEVLVQDYLFPLLAWIAILLAAYITAGVLYDRWQEHKNKEVI